jgi:hypothetical protein
MHFCRAMISLGGDSENVYYADQYAPISWPEIAVIQNLHGIDSVTAVEPFASVEQSPREERDRLVAKYGEEQVSEVFGGKRLPTEMDAPKAFLPYDLQWKNPITMQFERTPEEPDPEKAAAARKAK